MQRLAYLQRSLDPLDSEGLNTLLKTQQDVDLLDTEEDELADKLGGEVSLQEYEQFVESFLKFEGSSHTREEANVMPAGSSSGSSETKRISQTESTAFLTKETPLRTLIIAYLLSASFKDCSMIIKVTQDPNSTNQTKTLNAYLVDVDVKSIKRLARYAKLDRDLVDSFVRYTERGGVISDCHP